MGHLLRAEAGVRPAQERVDHHPGEAVVTARQRGFEGGSQLQFQHAVVLQHGAAHYHHSRFFAVRRQDAFAQVGQTHEDGMRQDELRDAHRPESRSLLHVQRGLFAARGLEGFALVAAVAEDVYQAAVLAHEAGFGGGEGVVPVGTVAHFHHDAGHRPEQQVKQVGGVTAHQRAGEAEHLLGFVAEHGHCLSLRGTGILVLVRLVDECQAEGFAREVAFDVLRRLIADHPQREFQSSQRFFQRGRVLVLENEVTFAVAEVHEILHVVVNDAGQHVDTEGFNQAVGTHFANTGQLQEEFAQLALRSFILEFTVTHRPQRLLALLAAFALLRSPFRGSQYWFVGAVALVCSAARAGNGIVTANGSLALVIGHGEAVRALPVGGSPVEAHAHSHPAKDEVVHPFGIEPSFFQIAAETDQLADGIAAVDDMHHCLRHGVEDFAAPFVDEMRR